MNKIRQYKHSVTHKFDKVMHFIYLPDTGFSDETETVGVG